MSKMIQEELLILLLHHGVNVSDDH